MSIINDSSDTGGNGNEVSYPEAWRHVGVDQVIERLYELTPTNFNIPNDYRKRKLKWSSMTEFQRKKFLAGWELLNLNYQNIVLKDVQNDNIEKVTERDKWNINDWSRLIHIFANPEGNKIFTDYFQSFSRLELDGRHSELVQSPANKIADIFNNYEKYVFQNPSFLIHNGVKISSVGKDFLFKFCAEFDPNDITRPTREATEVLKHFRALRTSFTRAYMNYKSSGNHESDTCQLTMFSSFNHGDLKLLYAFELWKDINISTLGRVLDEEGKADTSVGNEPAPLLSPHQPRRNKRKITPNFDKLYTNTDPLVKTNRDRTHIYGLKTIADLGTPETRAWATMAICQLLNIPLPPSLNSPVQPSSNESSFSSSNEEYSDEII